MCGEHKSTAAAHEERAYQALTRQQAPVVLVHATLAQAHAILHLAERVDALGKRLSAGDAWERVGEEIGAAKAAEERVPCGRIMVGEGTDTYDPLCDLPNGHPGACRSLSAINQHKLTLNLSGRMITAEGQVICPRRGCLSPCPDYGPGCP